MIISKKNEHMKYESPEENDIVIYPIDDDYDADTYDIDVDGENVEVAVGQFNDDDPFHLVRYCHVYLVKGDKVVNRIGVLEVDHEEENKDDDELDIEDHLLFFNRPQIKKLLNEHSQFGGAEVTLEVNKDSPEEKLGIKFKGGVGEPKKIVEVRNQTHGFKVGDLLIKLNDTDIRSKTTKEVIALIGKTNNIKFLIEREEEGEEAAGSKPEKPKALVCDYIPKPESSSTWDINTGADVSVGVGKGGENSLFQDTLFYLIHVYTNLVDVLRRKNEQNKEQFPQTPQIDEHHFVQMNDLFNVFPGKDENDLDSRITLPLQNYQSFVSQKNEFQEGSKLKTKIKALQANKNRGISNIWINYLFKDVGYDVVNPPADGDCLFYTIQKAFYTKGIYLSVAELRNIQRFYISYDRLDTLKAIVGPWFKDVKEKEAEIKDLSEKYRSKYSEKKSTPANLLKPALVELKSKYDTAVKELNRLMTNENPIPLDSGDIGFFNREKIIDDEGNLVGDAKSHFEKFLDYKVNYDWGDENTLIDIADALNIKIIVLETNVVNRELTENGVSNIGRYVTIRGNTQNPMFYIILTLSGSHFQLVTYKERGLFSEYELPYTLRFMIRQRLLMDSSDMMYNIMNTDFTELEQNITENKITSVYDETPTKYAKNILNKKGIEIPSSTESTGPFAVAGAPTPQSIVQDSVNRLFGAYKTLVESSDQQIKARAKASASAVLTELTTQFGEYYTSQNREQTVAVENIPAKIDLTNIVATPF